MKITMVIVLLFVFHASAYGQGVLVPGKEVISLEDVASSMYFESTSFEKTDTGHLREEQNISDFISYLLFQVRCEPVVGINDQAEKAVGTSL